MQNKQEIQNKRVWAMLLVVGLLYRVRLLDIQVWQTEGINWTAVLVACIGGILVFTAGYGLVTILQLHEVTSVMGMIVFGGILCNMLGRRLADLPIFDDFWGGFVAGGMESFLLWGTLYGAKEVWSAKPEEPQKPEASEEADDPDETQP